MPPARLQTIVAIVIGLLVAGVSLLEIILRGIDGRMVLFLVIGVATVGLGFFVLRKLRTPGN